ncbi:hypothetical protein BDV59DRAFT_31448 [Aspergillus ambiguus]|uniref:uncharacterized protein n=1 Tax=Aspergillus ambiguus TaxID=176160 RepID=UPI003CCE3BF2
MIRACNQPRIEPRFPVILDDNSLQGRSALAAACHGWGNGNNIQKSNTTNDKPPSEGVVRCDFSPRPNDRAREPTDKRLASALASETFRPGWRAPSPVSARSLILDVLGGDMGEKGVSRSLKVHRSTPVRIVGRMVEILAKGKIARIKIPYPLVFAKSECRSSTSPMIAGKIFSSKMKKSVRVRKIF